MRFDFVLAVATGALLLTGCAINPPMCHETRSKAESNLEPEYPKASKLQGEEGKTVLRVMVNALSFPETIEVKTSSGFESLDRAAVDAVKTWCFNPATKDGKYVPASVLIPIVFQLSKPNLEIDPLIKTTDDWIKVVRRIVRAHRTFPPNTPRSAEAVFTVEQSPDGHIVSIKLKSSSGFAPYDAASMRAIMASSPLPKFPIPGEFPKEFEVRMQPFQEPEATASSN